VAAHNLASKNTSEKNQLEVNSNIVRIPTWARTEIIETLEMPFAPLKLSLLRE
jgi:hypothetical protein